MIKSIFIDPTNSQGVEHAGANHLIITLNGINQDIWKTFQSLNINLSLTIGAFGEDGCPASPQAKKKIIPKT